MEKQSLTNQLVKSSFWNFMIILTGRVGGLIFVMLLARFLLPENFGIYHLTLSITLLLATFADVGINQTLIRYFSDALGRKNKKLALSRYKYLFRLKVFLTLLFAVLLFLLSYPLSFYVFKKPFLFLPLLFSSFYLLVYSFESFYESFFYILKKINSLAIRQFLWEVLRIILSLLVFILVSSYFYRVLGVIAVLIFSTALSIVYLLYILAKINHLIFEESEENLDNKGKKRINKFLFYISISNSLFLIFGYIDTIMIGIFLASEFVGFYSAALALVSGLSVLFSMPNVLLPIFIRLKKEKVNIAFSKVFKYTAIIAIPSTFGILILGKYVIAAVYGYDYLPAVLPLYFLSFLIIELPLTTAIASMFSAKEKPKYFANVLIISTIMNIALNYLLISSLIRFSDVWAMTGAAIATLISRLFYLVLLVLYARREMGISLRLGYLLKPLLASLVMASVLIYLNTGISNMTILIFIFEIISGVAIYFLTLFLIRGIKKEDFLLIKEVIK